MTNEDSVIEQKLMRTLAFFEEHGFDVVGCGFHDEENEFGFVVLDAKPHNLLLECDRVFKLLLDQGACPIDTEDHDSLINGTYDPEDGSCEIHICPIDDSILFAGTETENRLN